MRLTNVRTIGVGAIALVVVFYAAGNAQASGTNEKYPKMAPAEQYLMADRLEEIALARTAAPGSISHDAEILVLGRHGYETAVKGKNGFGCLVERAWNAGFESTEFWNPKIRGPVCYNPAAARSLLPLVLERAKLALAGLTKAQIMDSTTAATTRKFNPALEPGAVCYMMSKEAYLTDDGSHNLAHLMFYTSAIEAAALGADVPGSPVIMGRQGIPGAPSPVTEFYVRVPKWSDGTPATGQ
ncbi:MAG TPA: hypothetical protein VF102_07930 [Gemmatimonadaceae bacterium]